jgi:hypothetical protein
MVEARFEEAADTLRRLPNQHIQQCRSTWPAVVRDAAEAYGWASIRVRRGPPAADAIDRMDECLEWFTWLDGDDARLVWLRAAGVQWKLICGRIGVSRTTAWQRWVAALIVVATRLSVGSQIRASPTRLRSESTQHLCERLFAASKR